MDADGIESPEEEIAESFVCCVCLDLLLKPIVLSCGHISCFWCVHRSMSNLRDSHCPICRNPYNHFPTICQMLHFLLKKMYPLAYKRRESQLLEEEKEIGHFSPQFDDVNARTSFAKQGLNSSGSCTLEECSANSEQSGPTLQTKTEASLINDTSSSQNQLGASFDLITVEDVPCSGCKELLFRPVVLNCGHVYCESCLVHDERIRCEVCQSLHPKGLPKVSLVLARFLEERFPNEYARRRDSVQLKQVDCNGSKVADNKASVNKADSSSELGDPESNVHVGVGCDCCGVMPIIGDRYKCKDCVEEIGFDLCGECYKTTSKLPGRFNQQHTSEHKFDLIKSSPLFDRIFLRIRAARHNMENNMALLIGNYSSGDSEDGSTPLSLIRENLSTSIPFIQDNLESDASPGVEQDRDDSQPTT